MKTHITDVPSLVGVSEAARILDWRKQKVTTYHARAKSYRLEYEYGTRLKLPKLIFPEPVQELDASPIWTREQIFDYKSLLK